jgi:hypothetical protein
LIFDLSAPAGMSVNDGIPLPYGAITYETLHDAIRLVDISEIWFRLSDYGCGK